jgi:fumarylacetoacetate (FAA) hydrolase
MKLVHYKIPQSDASSLGVIIGDEIVDILTAWHAGLIPRDAPQQLAERIYRHVGMDGLRPLYRLLKTLNQRDVEDLRFPAIMCELLPPVAVPSFRDFYAFEDHVRNARKNRGLEMVPEWYDAPVFYFSNISSIVGTGAPVKMPKGTQELDYELEIGAVIGQEGRDISVSEADEYIAGFLIINDWSARDIQRQEMKVGLGPAKGKDFCTSIGPALVTPDELEDRILPDRSRGNQYDLMMMGAVNGKILSRGNVRDMNWTFAELIARASENTVLRPGDLIGSGTVGTGCLTEFARGTYPWLQVGDTVTLTIERLGTLENTIV